MRLTHGSLFTGIGGFDLAAEKAGFQNIFQVENDGFCQNLLVKNFPDTEKYWDIKLFNGERYKGTIDVISGGFPCQPFSHAGQRAGTTDDRYLWGEMLRVINEVQPSYIIGENVAGLISMDDGRTLETILTDLEAEEYIPEVFVIPACAVQAWHRRDRVWIIAHSNHNRELARLRKIQRKDEEVSKRNKSPELNNSSDNGNVANSGTEGLQGNKHTERLPAERSWWASEPGMDRVANGIPRRVDRIKALGNAIVPQVVLPIFEAIKEIEEQSIASNIPWTFLPS